MCTSRINVILCSHSAMNTKTSSEYNSKTLLVFAVIAACMLTATLVFGLMNISSYSNQYHLQSVYAIKDKNALLPPLTLFNYQQKNKSQACITG